MNNKRRFFKIASLTSVAVLVGACSTPPHVKPPGPRALHTGNANHGTVTSPASSFNTYSAGTPATNTVIPTPVATTTTTAASNNTGGAGSYVVKKGDTVYEVMRQTGVYWKNIIAMNNLQAPYTIHPGQALRLR